LEIFEYSAGDVIFLGRSHRFRFNNPQEAAKLREKQLVRSSLLCCNHLGLFVIIRFVSVSTESSQRGAQRHQNT